MDALNKISQLYSTLSCLIKIFHLIREYLTSKIDLSMEEKREEQK